MADISKITTPNNTTYNIKDASAIEDITRSGTTFTATRRDGTKFTFTQQDNNTTYSAGTGLSLASNTFSVKLGYTTSGNNRAVQADSNGNLYVAQKDDNTTYSAGTGLSLSSNAFSVKLGYTTSGNNRAVQADSNGNLYVTQKDDNTTYSANTGIKLNGTTFQHTNSVTAGTAGTSSATSGSTLAVPYVTYDAQGHITATGTHTHTVTGFLTSSSSLDASKLTGTVPTSVLPSYVDDVLEYPALTNFPSTGESGKIYIAQDTNKTYRWSGSAYVVISETLAIGTTASTAAAGNHTHNYAGSSSAGGAANTAIKFNSAQSVTLTGDVTGTASSQAGWSIATTLANSGATAGSYGPSANATPGYGATFNVPYITVDAKGRVTAISNKTVKIPASDNTNTDTLVTQTNSTTNADYRVLLSLSANDTTETKGSYKSTNFKANPSTGKFRATSFNVADKVTQQYNATTQALDFIFS